MDITYTPIGYVRSPEKESRKGTFAGVEAEIVVDEDLTGGLVGLEEFSHVEVIFVMHQPEPTIERDQLNLAVHPRGHREIPAVGLFATRSPNRPNRIGVTPCELLGVEGNVIRVRGLDALDGSPVLDLKAPVLQYYERYPEMRFARWMHRLKELDQRGEW